MTKKASEKEEKPHAIKQPVITNFIPSVEPNGLCDQKDFDYLKSKGFEVQAAKSSITFSLKSTQHANTVLNIRCENGEWSCAAVRSWDTKEKNYDASFSAKYKTLDALLDHVQSDFTARANLVESIKR